MTLPVGLWFGWRLWQVTSELSAAHETVTRISTALSAKDTAAAAREVTALQQHTAISRRSASDPLWRAFAAFPGVGDDLTAVRHLATATDDLATSVLPPLTRASAALQPDELRIAGDRLATGRVRQVAPELEAAAARSTQIRDSLSAAETRGLRQPVRDRVRDIRALAAQLADSASAAGATARLLPPLLGEDGVRRYFLAVQNSAEARGTGGPLAAYGVLEVDHGRVRVLRLGPNTDLRNVSRLPLDLGEDFAALYGDNPALWANANMSPHFPYAARLWLEMWHRQHGQRLDGVIATDAVALSYLLRATGDVVLASGQRVTPGNAVSLTLRDSHRADTYAQQITRALLDQLLKGAGDPRHLAAQLGRAAREGRLLAYSTRPDEEQQLASGRLGGALPAEAGPFAAVVVNNAAGHKLDHYLRGTIRYTSGACDGGLPAGRIEVRLTNTAPRRGLPPYVLLPVDKPTGTSQNDLPPGTNVSLVNLYAARGAQLRGATLNGRPHLVGTGRERGHPVFTTRLRLAPGGTAHLVLDLVEPQSTAAPRVWAQPLVRPELPPTTPRTSPNRCPPAP
jgi:hypothetical protein